MLLAHPTTLRELLDRYESVRVAARERPMPQLDQELENVTYTLCVTTGTRAIEQALRAARERLATVAVPVPD